MEANFRKFQQYMMDTDYSDWQSKIAGEYLEIGDSEVWGAKHCGSDAENEGSRYLAEKLKEIGVDKVELIPVTTDRCQFNDAVISFVDEERQAIRPYCNVSAGTDSEGVTAKVVDCGMGTKPELDAVDVAGKVVILCNDLNITEANPFLSISLLELEERGAAAACVWTKGVAQDTNMAVMNNFAIQMPVLSITPGEAEILKGVNGRVHLVVDSTIIPDGGTTYEVVGEIIGSESDERIVYTAHLDHYHRCLQDNVSAVITLLGIARAMVESGYKPRRTITFVFNGSHELGHVLSTSPDLKGPYELFMDKRTDIPGKAIANINFEYTAMTQHELRSLTSYETMSSYLDYVSQMPSGCTGFDKIASDVRAGDYYLLTWCDAIISIISGVPCYMNDAITEQIYLGDSPYIGRDHSNKDNWEIFSPQALRTCTFWYGCLAAFLDAKGYVEMDFSKRMDAIAFTDDEKKLLDDEVIAYRSFEQAAVLVKESGTGLYAKAAEKNKSENSMTQEIAAVNRRILDIHKTIGTYTDRFMANLITTLCPANKAYVSNLGMMRAAQAMLKEGKYHDAVGTLCGIDIAGLAYQFDGKYIDDCVEYIEGKNATWTKDRTCKCFPMTDVMAALKNKGADSLDYDEEIALLDRQIEKIKALIQEELTELSGVLNAASEDINACADAIR